MNDDAVWVRLATLVTLIESSPTQTLGRTSVVKLPYLLQALHRIDLGYRFRMYTYGPYDAEVLNDIGSAESLGAVSVKTIDYPNGYGYEIRVGAGADAIKTRAVGWLQRHGGSIAAVAAEFGGQSATDLELTSTVVFLDREASEAAGRVSIKELAERVRAVKPRFSEGTVLDKIEALRVRGYLTGLQPGTIETVAS